MNSGTPHSKLRRRLKLVVAPLLLVVALLTATLCFDWSDALSAIRVTAHSSDTTSLTTQERMYTAAWWPTKGDPVESDYVGEAACANCHSDITAIQHTTPMYHAATSASSFATVSQLEFNEGAYRYSVQPTTHGVTYSVSNGGGSESSRILWAFGDSQTGQTYLLGQRDGYMESRLSYYAAPKGLDITVGHSAQPPTSVHDALGRELTFETAQRCFACHTTASTVANEFKPERSVPGITCEACHGPGAAHIAAANAGKHDKTVTAVTNPASMSPSDSVDFCGSCHRSFADVSVFMPANLGAVSVRFQPYRLEKSPCWGKSGDPRITCVACHDPHKPLVRDAAAYDHDCLACHSDGIVHKGTAPTELHTLQPGSRQSAPACKVATSKCTSCHMPKVEVPQTHAAFTDHQIRIVRARSQ